MNYVECGKQEGAKVITGGKRSGDKGYFIEPVCPLALTSYLMIYGDVIRPSSVMLPPI